MRKLLWLAAIAVFASPAAAHPPVSIVFDSRGNLFYSDLVHVWRLSPDGSRSIAVRNVHTHELAIDDRDQLFGEDQRFEPATETWSHSVWKRSPAGAVTTVIPRRGGVLRDYAFVRDRAGTMYWVDRAASTVVKRPSGGRASVMARARFSDVRWLTVTGAGTVYLIDYHSLIRVGQDGEVTTVAKDITRGEGRHALMGLWTDRAGNVYVADHASRQVKRIDASGRVTAVATSPPPWAPTGGAFDGAGNLWLLEADRSNRIRVRKK